MVPTTRAVGAMVLFIVLLWYAATSEVPWLFLCALWLLALGLAAFAYAAWNRRGVTLVLTVRENRPARGSPATDMPEMLLRRSPFLAPVFEGDGMSLEIAFRARRGPRGPVWAVGQVGDAEFVAGAGLVTKEPLSRVRSARALRRGALMATGWSMFTSDPLGLFQGFQKMPEAEVVLVLPKFASLAAREDSREVEASVAAPRAGSGNELFGIREYRPGDSLRRIHWRSSARRGELVVREYEPPGVRTLGILADPRPPAADVADQIARIAASEAWDCLREGGRVTLSGALETRDMWEVLEWLARYPHNPSATSRAVRAGIQTDGEEVVIAANPALLVPGARRNWLVGDARVEQDVAFQRVGTRWPI